jgi:hypothetical protein
VLIPILALLMLAGCGGDDDQKDTSGKTEERKTEPLTSEGTGKPVGARGGRQGAKAFVDCFAEDGYKEKLLSQPSGTALVASTQGYKVATVFLESDKGAFYSLFVNFFESEGKLQEAKRKIKELKFGTADVPKADERGAAVVEYTTKQAREEVRDPILACLG